MKDPNNLEDKWNILRTEIINVLVKLLFLEIVKEIREELKEQAETTVIERAKLQYQKMLMTGPFTTKSAGLDDDRDMDASDVLIKERDRHVVMGVLMHPIDAKNYVVTAALVDRYGEYLTHMDFMRLI
jgi:transcriptional accessory protein Tex/SPT6